METGSVKCVSGSPQAERKFEDATSEAPTRDEGSTAAFVAMVACNAILLFMFAA
jgi:hypothetical protein